MAAVPLTGRNVEQEGGERKHNQRCLLCFVQHEPDLEGHAVPGGEDVAAQTSQRPGLEDQRSGPPRYDRERVPATGGILCACVSEPLESQEQHHFPHNEVAT